jgi:hypothetical protein
MTNLGLTLNETKTCLRTASRDSFDFLGYTFGRDRYRKTGQTYLAAKPSKKSVQRLKRAVRAQLRPGNQGRWTEVRDRLNRMLRGWQTYFSYGSRVTAYRAVDNYVYASVRHFLCRRHNVPTRGTRRFSAEQVFGPLGVTPNASAAGRRSVVCLGVKPVGEPDAGNPHVRFDERRRETASWCGLRHRRSAKAAGPATPRTCPDRARLRLYREEQRSPRGCIARRMQPDFHHGLLRTGRAGWAGRAGRAG